MTTVEDLLWMCQSFILCNVTDRMCKSAIWKEKKSERNQASKNQASKKASAFSYSPLYAI